MTARSSSARAVRSVSRAAVRAALLEMEEHGLGRRQHQRVAHERAGEEGDADFGE